MVLTANCYMFRHTLKELPPWSSPALADTGPQPRTCRRLNADNVLQVLGQQGHLPWDTPTQQSQGPLTFLKRTTPSLSS